MVGVCVYVFICLTGHVRQTRTKSLSRVKTTSLTVKCGPRSTQGLNKVTETTRTTRRVWWRSGPYWNGTPGFWTLKKKSDRLGSDGSSWREQERWKKRDGLNSHLRGEMKASGGGGAWRQGGAGGSHWGMDSVSSWSIRADDLWTHVNTHTHTHSQTEAQCKQRHTDTHMNTHTCMHTHRQTDTQSKRRHPQKQTHAPNTHMNTHAGTLTDTQTKKQTATQIHTDTQNTHTRTHTGFVMYTWMCILLNMSVCEWNWRSNLGRVKSKLITSA